MATTACTHCGTAAAQKFWAAASSPVECLLVGSNVSRTITSLDKVNGSALDAAERNSLVARGKLVEVAAP